MAAPNPQVGPKLWDALRKARAPASIKELQRSTPGRHHHLQARLRAWADLGLVEETPGQPGRFAIAQGVTQPRREGALGVLVWRAMRRLDRPVSLQELIAATGAGDRSIYCRLFRWIRDGLVVRIEPQPMLFTLTAQAQDVEAPPEIIVRKPQKRPSARARIWAAMRVLKRFDVPVLIMTAEANQRACAEMIGFLCRAGYAKPIAHQVNVQRREGSHAIIRDYSTYVLLRNTGPQCPRDYRPKSGGRFLFDPNNGQQIALVSRQPKRAREVNHGH